MRIDLKKTPKLNPHAKSALVKRKRGHPSRGGIVARCPLRVRVLGLHFTIKYVAIDNRDQTWRKCPRSEERKYREETLSRKATTKIQWNR